jgi:hypothetical protein
VTEEIRLTFAVSQSATVNEEMVGVARMCMKGERGGDERRMKIVFLEEKENKGGIDKACSL